MSYSSGRDEGLGIAIASAITAGGGITKTLGGMFAKDKNPGRLEANLKAYNSVVTNTNTTIGGDPYTPAQSLEFLRVKSTPGAWATELARADAEKKYKAALAYLAARKQSPTSTSAPAGGPRVATAGMGPVISGVAIPPIAIAGIAAAGIYFLTQRR